VLGRQRELDGQSTASQTRTARIVGALFAASGGGGGTTTTTVPTTTTSSSTTTTGPPRPRPAYDHTTHYDYDDHGSGSARSHLYDDLTEGLVEVTGSTQAWYYPNLQGGTQPRPARRVRPWRVTLYDPFGNTLSSLQLTAPTTLPTATKASTASAPRRRGQRHVDGGSSLQPRTGRFLQVDPVFGGSCNAYDYVCQTRQWSDLNGLDYVYILYKNQDRVPTMSAGP